jgi:hypothetical protein
MSGDVCEGFGGKDRVHRIVAELLTSALMREDRVPALMVWEREALKWLAEEWDRDETLSWCGWTGARVREFRSNGGLVHTSVGWIK